VLNFTEIKIKTKPSSVVFQLHSKAIFKSWQVLYLRLLAIASPFGQVLRALALTCDDVMTCANFDRDQICT